MPSLLYTRYNRVEWIDVRRKIRISCRQRHDPASRERSARIADSLQQGHIAKPLLRSVEADMRKDAQPSCGMLSEHIRYGNNSIICSANYPHENKETMAG